MSGRTTKESTSMTAHLHTSISTARVTRVAFLTAGGLVLVVAVGLLPVLGQFAG
jgi:hypothetical protein